MRAIDCKEITKKVSELCQEANFFLPQDVIVCLKNSLQKETSPLGKEVLQVLLENAEISKKDKIPLCQDCGLTVIFAEIGQDVQIKGGDFQEAVQEGVRRGYINGYLRKSAVTDPVFERLNTKDNTPAVIHTDIVPGDKLKIVVLPKGGGSENMSALKMLKPAQGVKGVKEFVLDSVESAGPNPCPPVIVGVGIGGTSDKAVLLAKKSLLRKVGKSHPDSKIAQLEKELLTEINNLGIGPQGFGGRTTALAVHIEIFPCHIASLPVAVNLQCHSARWKEAVI